MHFTGTDPQTVLFPSVSFSYKVAEEKKTGFPPGATLCVRSWYILPMSVWFCPGLWFPSTPQSWATEVTDRSTLSQSEWVWVCVSDLEKERCLVQGGWALLGLPSTLSCQDELWPPATLNWNR